MDRLTSDELDYETLFCMDCHYYGEPNGCNRPGSECGSYCFFTAVYESLKNYESAGLSVEQVQELAKENIPAAIDKLVAYESSGFQPEELAELGSVKIENRLVILPCKPADPFFPVNRYSGEYENLFFAGPVLSGCDSRIRGGNVSIPLSII